MIEYKNPQKPVKIYHENDMYLYFPNSDTLLKEADLHDANTSYKGNTYEALDYGININWLVEEILGENHR